MASLEVRLLGGFEARLKTGQSFDLPNKKAKLLLSFLALPAGQVYPRQKLASLLWSDRADAQAQHSLRQSISSLRKALSGAESQPLLADRQTVGLDPAAVTVDVARFEALLAKGTVEALRQACALYRGELLEGESARDRPFEEWLFYERRRCRDLALRAFEQLLDHQRGAGESAAAVDTAQRLLTLSPAHEEGHRALIGIYAGQGRRTAALEQYERCRTALERELAVAPEPETEEMYREILETRPAPSPVPAAEPAPRPPQRAAPSARIAAPLAPRALELPEKPSVAVLPFDNMSGDPGQDYFCDGITEDIITGLSRFRSLFVIARHSCFAYRGHGKDLRQVGRELGVQHIVEGSLQRSGKRVRVTVQLIDAENGHHMWAERYDRELEDIFAVQDEVTSQIVGHATRRIDDQRLQIAKQRQPESLQAYDFWLQAKKPLDMRSLTGIAEGRRLLERALLLDPHFARAYADLSRSYVFEAHYLAGGTGMQDKIAQAFRLAQTAVSLDDSDSRSLTCISRAHLFRREFQFAGEQSERATSFNPCDATALMFRAQTQAYIGDSARGAELANMATRLNPYHPEWYRLMFATIYFLARRYEDSFEACHLSPDMLPDTAAWKAAVCAQLDRLDEARGFMDQFVRNVRGIWIGETPPGPGAYKQYLLDVNPLARQEDIEHLLDSLYKAGLPE